MNLIKTTYIWMAPANYTYAYIVFFSFQWAHFPNIHFGLGTHESSKKLDEAIGAAGGPQKVQDI